MASEAGKGSRPRPYSIDQKTFDNNWDAIFRKNKSANEELPKNLQEADKRIADHSGEDQQ